MTIKNLTVKIFNVDALKENKLVRLTFESGLVIEGLMIHVSAEVLHIIYAAPGGGPAILYLTPEEAELVIEMEVL